MNQEQAGPSQHWESNLCNCAPFTTCLLSTFLPCILIGRTSSRMRDPSMQMHEDLNSDCMIFSAIHCLTGCGGIYAMLKRREIREQFGINGSTCGDFCATYCCLCCALIQQDNEVKLRTQQAPVTQGYQSEKEGYVYARLAAGPAAPRTYDGPPASAAAAAAAMIPQLSAFAWQWPEGWAKNHAD